MLGRLAYNISNGLTAGINVSYDQAYETRFSADLKYRFGGNGKKIQSENKDWQTPVIQSLTGDVKHRDVKIHDYFWDDWENPLNVFVNPFIALIAPGTAVEMQLLNAVRGTGIGSYVNPQEATRYLTCLVIGPFFCLTNGRGPNGEL